MCRREAVTGRKIHTKQEDRMEEVRPVSSSINIHGVDEVRLKDKKVKSDIYDEGFFWVTEITLVSADGRSDVDISVMARGGHRIPVSEKYEGIDDEGGES